MDAISVAGHLNALLDQVEAGESIDITRNGKPIARLTPATPPRKPVDIAMLRALTATIPVRDESAAQTVRTMRDDDRY